MVGNFYKKYGEKYILPILLLSQILIQVFFLLDYDISSVKFLPRIVSLLFVALIVNGVCFTVFFFIFRKRFFKIPATLGLFISNILIYITLYQKELSFVINQGLGDWLVNAVLRFRFVHVAVSDGNLSWAIALGFYIGIALLIFGQWFVKKKSDFDNKVEKQLIYMGLGLYLVLFPFVFVFTHFTFVGANYQYIQGIFQYTDSAVQIYEKQNQKEYMQIKDLHWFPDINTAVNYYKQPQFKINTENAKNKKAFYEAAISKLDDLNSRGWQNREKITYDKMQSFHHWVQVSYNFNMEGEDAIRKTLWYSEISPVLTDGKKEDQDLLRHSILYLHQTAQGDVYAMLSFDRTFKDHKMNYIFNIFFILYHFVYLGLFVYLITIHDKKHLGKKEKGVQNV